MKNIKQQVKLLAEKVRQLAEKIVKIIKFVFLITLGITAALTLYLYYTVASNQENIRAALKRPDLMEVVKKIDREEAKQIEDSTKEIKKDNIKRMLSPLVIKESEGVN